MECPVCTLHAIRDGKADEVPKMRKRKADDIFEARGIIGLAMRDVSPDVEWWHCTRCGLVLMRLKR